MYKKNLKKSLLILLIILVLSLIMNIRAFQVIIFGICLIWCLASIILTLRLLALELENKKKSTEMVFNKIQKLLKFTTGVDIFLIIFLINVIMECRNNPDIGDIIYAILVFHYVFQIILRTIIYFSFKIFRTKNKDLSTKE